MKRKIFLPFFEAAVEVCDGIDNNCNVLIDEGADSTAPEGASTFYADFDGDGFGNVNVTTIQCSQPNGYVTNIDDCNDGNDQIHPNADEYCNAVDEKHFGMIPMDNWMKVVERPMPL